MQPLLDLMLIFRQSMTNNRSVLWISKLPAFFNLITAKLLDGNIRDMFIQTFQNLISAANISSTSSFYNYDTYRITKFTNSFVEIDKSFP